MSTQNVVTATAAAFTTPAQVVSFSFNAIRDDKLESQLTEWKAPEFEGLQTETFKDREGKERTKRAPVAIKVAEINWSEKQITALCADAIRSTLKSVLDSCHFEEISEEDFHEVFNAELSSGTSGGISFTKEERAELEKAYSEFLVEQKVPEAARAVHTPILYSAGADSKLKVFGNWTDESQREIVVASCNAVVARLETFRDTQEGISAAFVQKAIEAVKNYAANGPKPKAKPDTVENLLTML